MKMFALLVITFLSGAIAGMMVPEVKSNSVIFSIFGDNGAQIMSLKDGMFCLDGNRSVEAQRRFLDTVRAMDNIPKCTPVVYDRSFGDPFHWRDGK